MDTREVGKAGRHTLNDGGMSRNLEEFESNVVQKWRSCIFIYLSRQISRQPFIKGSISLIKNRLKRQVFTLLHVLLRSR